MFKVGEIVTCIDASKGGWSKSPKLTKGKNYCIITIKGSNIIRIKDDQGERLGFYSSRFRPAEPIAAPSIPEVVISQGEIKCSR